MEDLENLAADRKGSTLIRPRKASGPNYVLFGTIGAVVTIGVIVGAAILIPQWSGQRLDKQIEDLRFREISISTKITQFRINSGCLYCPAPQDLQAELDVVRQKRLELELRRDGIK